MSTETTRRWWVSPFDLPDGGKSFSEMWGTKAEVCAIATTRGFGRPKKYTGCPKEMRPSKWATQKGMDAPSTFHTLCYLGFLAARSGVVRADELVCDGSALHELSHYLEGVRTRQGRAQAEIVMDAMRRLERITPGLPPDELELLS